MLNADKRRIELLASDDESVRVAAAEELNRLELGHFEDHPVSATLVKRISPALLAAHKSSNAAEVKRWVVQLLADAGVEGIEVDKLVVQSLQPDCQYLPSLLYYIYRKHSRFSNLKDQVKALCQHADEQVRWRCALVLERLPLVYEDDADTLRQLAVDSYYTTRTYAVLALKKIGVRGSIDLEVLRRVVAIDDGAARHYANELLGPTV